MKNGIEDAIRTLERISKEYPGDDPDEEIQALRTVVLWLVSTATGWHR